MKKWVYTESIPENVYVACSGGVDSVATAAILSEWRNVTLLHYSHADHAHKYEYDIVQELAHNLKVKLLTSQQTEEVVSNREEAWRDARYNWFHSFDGDVATGHTLDDMVSWYLMTCFRGEGQIMESRNKNVFRPFLLTVKDELVKYCEYRGLRWFEDPSNSDVNFTERNRVVNNILPEVLKINPGFYKTVRKRFLQKRSRHLSTA